MNDYDKMENGMKIPKLCLTITCSWPYEKRSFSQKLISISWALIAFVYGWLMYIEPVIGVRNNDVLKLFTTIHWPLLVTAYLTKYLNFVYNKKYVVELENLLSNSLFYDHPESLKHHLTTAIRRANILGKCYMMMVFTYVTIYWTSPIISSQNLPTPISIDFGNYLPMIYLIQVIGLAHGAFVNGGIDLIYISMVFLGCSQLDILNEKILNLRNFEEEITDESTTDADEIDRKLIKKLANIVEHHNLIIKFFAYQEKILSLGLLVQFLSTIVALSCTGFVLLLVKLNTTDFYIAIMMFPIVTSQMFFYCYFGNMIIDKSVQIADACYFFEWYKCNPVIIKSLIIIMQRSAKPLAITIMKFAPFSLELFKDILRTSYSYFAVLLHFANKTK